MLRLSGCRKPYLLFTFPASHAPSNFRQIKLVTAVVVACGRGRAFYGLKCVRFSLKALFSVLNSKGSGGEGDTPGGKEGGHARGPDWQTGRKDMPTHTLRRPIDPIVTLN